MYLAMNVAPLVLKKEFKFSILKKKAHKNHSPMGYGSCRFFFCLFVGGVGGGGAFPVILLDLSKLVGALLQNE